MELSALPVTEDLVSAEVFFEVRQQGPQPKIARQRLDPHGLHSLRSVSARHFPGSDGRPQATSRNLKGPQTRREEHEAPPFFVGLTSAYEQPLVVPQLTHLWQLPLGIMIDPHSGQVGASVRAMKL